MIGAVVLLLFGGKKIPELMRGLGQGMREFKEASSGVRREIEDSINNTESTRKSNRNSKETGSLEAPSAGAEEADSAVKAIQSL